MGIPIFSYIRGAMIKNLNALLTGEEDSITYKGKRLTVLPSSTPESIHFKLGDRRFTVHPDWANPDAISEISKEIEKYD